MQTVILDACVLYPAGLRDFLLRLVEAGVFLDLVAGVLIMLVFVSGLTHRLAHATAGELRVLRG